MPEVNYGGFTIDWSKEELAKIEECRSWAAARRMLGVSNKGAAIQQFNKNEVNAAALLRIAREVYVSTST